MLTAGVRFALSATLVIFGGRTVCAQTVITWANAGTAFSGNANWSGGLAPANDLTSAIAAFAGTSLQPALTADRSVAGLQFSGTDTTTLSGAFTLTLGASGVTQSSATGTKTVSASLALGAAQSFSNAGTLTLSGSLANAGSLLTLTGSGLTGTISGVVSGTGGIAKTGTGLWKLSGVNTYSGGTTLSAGTLQAIAATSLGSGVVTVADGAQLLLTGFSGTVANTLTFTGAGPSAGGALLFNENFAAITLSGPVTVAGGAVLRSYSVSSTLTFSQPLAGTGGLTLAAGGAASNHAHYWVLAGTTASTYTGNTLVRTSDGAANAVLKLAGGALPSTTVLTLEDRGADATRSVAAVFDLNGQNQTLAGLTRIAGALGAGAFVTNTSGTASTLTVNAAADSAFSGVIGVNTSGATTGLAAGGNNLSLVKSGAATFTLSGANTYTGATTVSAGTLALGANNALADTTSLSVASGATFSLGSFTDTIGDVAGAGTLSLGSGTLTTSGTGASTSFTGALTGSGTFAKTGSGTLTITGANSFTGTTSVSGGTLAFNTSSASLPDGPLLIDSGGAANITVPINTVWGFSRAISGDGTLTVATQSSSSITLTANSTFTGTLNLPANSSVIIGGGGGSPTTGALPASLTNLGDNSRLGFLRTNDYVHDGAITGTGLVYKNQTGTLTLGGVNTFSGGLVIANGLLEFSAAQNLGTGVITLAGGGLRWAAGNTADISALLGPISYNPIGFGGSGTIDTNGNNVTFATGLSGTYGLTKTGAGTLTLTGDATYGGTTTVSAGTLSIGVGGTTGSIAGAIVNNASLAFNRSDAVTLGTAVSGTGAFVKLGAGTLSLTGANTFTGGTTVSAGTLSIGVGGTVGSIAGDIVDNAALVFNRSDALTFSGVISGSGSLTKLGASTLTLTGANTFTVGTTISAGTLAIGAGGTIGSLTGDIVDNAALTFNRSDAVTFSGVISGSGSLTKLGASTLTLTGANTFTGGTTISAGTLAIGVGGTVGWISGNIVDNAALTFNRSDAVTFSGVISGTGSLTKLGASTLTLTGANTFTGGTTISAGTLAIGAGGTVGSLAGNVVNNTALVFNRSDALTFAGNISGTGAVSHLGGGTLTLGGGNSFSGVLAVTGGTLSVGSAAALGSASGTVRLTGATLASTASFTATRDLVLDTGADTFSPATGTRLQWDGVVSGGALHKTGAGVLALTATNTYSGGTTITGGTVEFTTSANLGSGVLTLDGGGVRWVSGGTADISSRIQPLGVGGGIFDTNGNDVTLGTSLSGSGALIKTGAGYLTFAGANTFTGGVTVTGGTIEFSQVNVFGSAGSGQSGRVTLDGGGLRWASGTTTDISARLDPLGTGGGTFDTNGNSFSYTAALTGAGGFTKAGAGTLTLTTANTYAGPTAVTGGTLLLGVANALPAATGASVSSGATLDLGSISASLGGLGGAGTVALGSATLTIDTAGAHAFSGALTGAGALLKLGAGTLSLSGVNTYAGVTTVSAGTLEFSGGSFAASTITNHATVAFNRADSSTFSTTISGTGALLKLGTGTVALTGVNTFTGVTTISAGTLGIGNGGTTGSLASASIVNNATLAFNRTDAVSLTATISGAGALVQNGSGTLTLSAAQSFTGVTTVNAGTLALGASDRLADSTALTVASGASFSLGAFTEAIGSLSGAGVVALGSGSLRVGGDNTSTTFSGAFTGTGALTKTGAGTLTLSGTTFASGTLTVSGGAVSFSSPTAFTTSLALDGGALRWAAGTTRDFSAQLAAIGSGGATFDTNGNNVTFASGLSGAGGFTKSGAGTLTLSAGSTYSGATTVSAGTLAMGATDALPTSTALTVSSGATLALGGFGTTIGTLAGSGTVSLGSGTLTAGGANQSSTFSGAMSGTGGLVKTGSGRLTLISDLAFSGTTTISAGTLTLGANGTTGHLSGPIVNNGTLEIALSQFSSTIPNVISGTGNVVSNLFATLTGNNTYTGTTSTSVYLMIGNGGTSGSIAGNLHLPSFGNGVVLFNRSDTVTYAGNITGGGYHVDQSGTGTLILTGAATFSGEMRVNSGTLAFGDGGASGSYTGTIYNGGVLRFNRSDDVVHAGVIVDLTADRHPGPKSGSVTKLGAGTLTFTNNNSYSGGTTLSAGTLRIGNAGTTGSVAGDIVNNAALVFNRSDSLTYAGVISGTGTLTQSGPGTLVLTNAQTFTGGTTIAGGTLQLGAGGTTGSLASTTLSTSGTLAFNRSDNLGHTGVVSGTGGLTQAGTGTLTVSAAQTYTGATTVSAGTLTLGAADRIADASALTVATGATFNLANFSETVGSLAGGGTVSLGSGAFNAGGDNATTTFSGALTGTGAFTKSGAGTLSLSGTNTAGGATTVSAGTLRLGAGGTTGSVAGSITNNAAVAFNRSDAFTFSNVISGTGGVTQLGVGTVTLGAAQTYTGGTTISAGTLALGAAERLANTGAVAVSGGTFALGAFNETVGALTITSGAITGSGTLTVSDFTADAGTVSANLAVSGVFTKNTAGTLTLNGAVTPGSHTMLSAGTVTLGASERLPDNRTLYVYGGTLNLGAFNETVGNVVLAGGEINGAGGTLTASAIDLNGGSATANFAGNFSLTKSSGSAFVLGGSHSYTGSTSINTGWLYLSAGNVLPDTTAVSIAGGAALIMQNNSDTIGSLSGGSNVSAGGTLSLGTGGLTLGGNNSSSTYYGEITGSGSLTKVGSGTFSLGRMGGSNSPTVSAAITVSAGTLATVYPWRFSGSTTLNVAAGALLSLVSDESVASLSGAGRVEFTVPYESQFTLGGNASTTFSGAISASPPSRKTAPAPSPFPVQQLRRPHRHPRRHARPRRRERPARQLRGDRLQRRRFQPRRPLRHHRLARRLRLRRPRRGHAHDRRQ